MNKEIRKFLNDHLSVVDFQYDPIKKGGSDRNFYRVRLPHGPTFIFMEYGTDVEENAYWAAINRFMTEIGITTPRSDFYCWKTWAKLICIPCAVCPGINGVTIT
jgi:hypothetical protein